MAVLGFICHNKHMKNLPLIIGIALPFIFIIIIAAVVYLPNAFINPEHDFIYTAGDGYYYEHGNVVYKNVISLENGKIILQPVVLSTTNNNTNRVIKDHPPIYRYDVKNSSAREITLAEAQQLGLDPGPTAPDGYSISYKY